MVLFNFTIRKARIAGLCLALFFGALTSTPASAEEVPESRFTHEMILDPVPGLPATVEVHTQDAPIESVRLLIVIDEELFVIPLRETSEHNFTANFPSPRRKVRYTFQFAAAESKTSLSQPYVREQTCAPGTPSTGDGRGRLLSQAADLDTDSERLHFLTRSIAGLKE